MPVTFKQIAAKTASLTLHVGDEENNTITIVYYPNLLTERVLAEMEAGITKDNDLLEKLIKSWDVYEDDEHTVMFPLSRINEFGLKFKQELGEAIGNALRPNLATAQMNGSKSI